MKVLEVVLNQVSDILQISLFYTRIRSSSTGHSTVSLTVSLTVFPCIVTEDHDAVHNRVQLERLLQGETAGIAAR